MAEGSGGARGEGVAAEESNQTGVGRGEQTMPLNSRRLTALLLRRLADGLGVPIGATQADLRPMIEGKLTESGRDPLHIQVITRSVENGTHLSLRDESGIFAEFEPPEPENPPLADTSESSEEDDETELVSLRAEVERLKEELESQTVRTRDMWRLNCEQLAEMDKTLTEKDDEINRLKEELNRSRRSSPSPPSTTSEMSDPSLDDGGTVHLNHTRTRRGKAPPVDAFAGADPECRLDDWLPTLKRAADWNCWAPEDLLIQLAGHLKGRALQEWILLSEDEKKTYEIAVVSLESRLDPGSRIMAAQDFRHASQDEGEKAADFV